MTAFLIGAAELSELVAGQACVVAAPGMKGLESLPLMVLQPQQGVLRRAGANPDETFAMPLPDAVQPIAILAPDGQAVGSLAAGLPIGIPVLVGSDPMRVLLAYLLKVLVGTRPILRVVEPDANLAPAPGFIEPAAPDIESNTEAAPTAAPPPAASLDTAALSRASFQSVRLYQHTVSADGGYRHIDLGLVGLSAAAGLWREARMKLFDRRGTVGIEVRDIRGWPSMFDVWPSKNKDQYGQFWRLDTLDSQKTLGELASQHNRDLVEALLDVLPAAAQRAAELAELPVAESEQWAERGRILASAAAEAQRAMS